MHERKEYRDRSTMKIEEEGFEDEASQAESVASEGSKKKAVKPPEKIATLGETLGFAFETGIQTKIVFGIGVLGGIGNGLVSLLLLRWFQLNSVGLFFVS